MDDGIPPAESDKAYEMWLEENDPDDVDYCGGDKESGEGEKDEESDDASAENDGIEGKNENEGSESETGDDESEKDESDRSKGLINTVKNELPSAEHIMYVKHIIENLKKKHSKKDLLKPLVWKLAWSYNPTEIEENLQNMREYDMHLYEDVMKEYPNTLCRAFYRLRTFYEDIDNNTTESFNVTIVKARANSMVPMLETIRRQALERIAKRQKKSSNHQSKFSEYVEKILASEKGNADRCTTYAATHGMYEVVLDGCSYLINTVRSTCSCFKWQITGILCGYTYGAMIDVGLDVEDYVTHFFS